ncbi:reverse transcriptase domain-containing protein [Tanacetum coccineum]|uniref:Reverse transcriptase domain-containing protein n=1 Tax=Tanacetum coccineum TaxID=301880 RepID=A0ABQ5C735_9ASTR
MNEQAADKEKEQKAESVHEEVKEEEGAKKRKLGTRRKLKAKRRKYTSSLTREDDDLKFASTYSSQMKIKLDKNAYWGWGDLMIMFNQENRYPLTKEVLLQMLDLKLETEDESTMALELIKFVKQQLEEFEDSNDDDLATSDHEEAERDYKSFKAHLDLVYKDLHELKDLPPYLEYAFLEGDDKLPVIIAKDLSVKEKAAVIKVLKSHKRAIAWKLSDIKGINLKFCTHKILMEEDYKPAVQHQRRMNSKIHDVIKKEVEKHLDAGLIYPILDSPWVSPVHYVPKKGGFTIVKNDENELILTRLVTGWRVCIDYRKLNDATSKDHFLLPFMDQMLERLAGNEYYCFLDGFSGYFQIPIDPHDQEKTTFTCPYGMFAYRRMSFGLCNAPGTFQRCMMAIFHDMIEKTMEVFMDDFSVFGNLFGNCLSRIVLGHKISKNGIEVDKAKVDVIAKLPHPTTVKGVRSFLGHAGFYRWFIKDFSKISRPMTHLLEKNTPFIFSDECIEAFETLKKKLTEAPILIAPDWDLPFELM